MAIIWLEGFKGLQTSNLDEKGYTVAGSPTVDTTNGRDGDRCLKSSTYSAYIQKSFTALTTIYIGFAMKMALFDGTDPDYSLGFLTIGNGSGQQVKVQISETGKINVLRYNSSTPIASGSIFVSAGVYHYFEIQITASNTVGAVTIKVDGQEHINSTGLDTIYNGSEEFTYVRFGSNWTKNTYFDDIYIDDAALKGELRIDKISPGSAGNYSQWTPSTGSNYACVDEVPSSATDYVQSSTANQIDTYTFEDLSALSSTILATMLSAMVKKTDADPRGVSPVTRSNSTDYVGSETTLTTSDAYMTEIRETDPDTASAWTESGVNNAEFGVKLTT